MKKSPWKFLVGLASRRRDASAGETSSALTSDSDVSPAQETEVAGEASAAPSAVRADDQQAPAVLDAPDPAVDNADDSAGAAHASSSDGEEHASAPVAQVEITAVAEVEKEPSVEPGPALPQARRTRGPGRPKSIGDKGIAGGVSGPVVPEPTVADNPFLEQMANLDEEVQQLRLHLADKLRMQNEQLRKMLERFNRPS